MRRRRQWGTVGLALSGAVAIAWATLPAAVERRMNGVHGPTPPVSERARRLHESLLVADLHADSLLWGRELSRRADRGHVDLPRLAAGNVAIQGFTVVTRAPRGLNIHANPADAPDDITLLALVQRWPVSTWGSLEARALYQARRLEAVAAGSDGKLRLLRTAADVERFAADRRGGQVAGLLGLEGAHALEGRVDAVDELFDAGYRMIAPVHFFDNELGGSAHGVDQAGLTAFGRQVLARMAQRHMIVDLAHASPALIDDVLEAWHGGLVVSHTGVRGTCDNQRNLSDDQLRRVAAAGGVIGIGFWDTATCGNDAAAIARAIRYAISVAGADHVAFGSDFDGAVTTPFDAAGLASLTQALLDAGEDEPVIRAVAGGNVARLLATALPPGTQ